MSALVSTRFPVPSATLLRAFLRPNGTPNVPCQSRSTHTFMQRHKYAKVNRLDKLHRQQKKSLLQERLASYERALQVPEKMASESTQETITAQPFHIARTKTLNMPVYETTKAGGSKKITTVRHVSGDVAAAQRQLQAILDLPAVTIDGKGRKKTPVAINHLNQHIIIAGWRGAEVKKWAEVLGF